MTTLYLDRSGITLSASGGCLEVRREGGLRATYPLRLLRRVVLVGCVGFDAATLACLAEAGIGLVCLGGRSHRRVATIVGGPGAEARRRLAQYRCAIDQQAQIKLARWVVETKLNACLRQARRLPARRPQLRRACRHAAESIQSGIDAAAGASLASLRGIEGAAASSWFRVLVAAMPKRYQFTGRNRRPPRDPVNAAMSLAYTLAHSDAVWQIHAAGLDPMIGFLHEPSHGRESLACDLVEPLRARIDMRLLSAFSSDQLRLDHFNQGQNGCRMSKAGRAVFYALWEDCARAYRRYLRAEVYRLVNLLESGRR